MQSVDETWLDLIVVSERAPAEDAAAASGDEPAGLLSPRLSADAHEI
jgi:hypothetical protein